MGLVHPNGQPVTRAQLRDRLDESLAEALTAEQRELDRVASWGAAPEAQEPFERGLGL
jgi:hypothetical protein